MDTNEIHLFATIFKRAIPALFTFIIIFYQQYAVDRNDQKNLGVVGIRSADLWRQKQLPTVPQPRLNIIIA